VRLRNERDDRRTLLGWMIVSPVSVGTPRNFASYSQDYGTLARS